MTFLWNILARCAMLNTESVSYDLVEECGEPDEILGGQEDL